MSPSSRWQRSRAAHVSRRSSTISAPGGLMGRGRCPSSSRWSDQLPAQRDAQQGPEVQDCERPSRRGRSAPERAGRSAGAREPWRGGDVEPGESGCDRRDFSRSRPSWPEPRRATPGSPNVVVVILDDVGFAQLGCFRVRHRHARVRPPRRRRPAVANFRATALFSHPGLRAHRAQPPHERHGPHRRAGDQLPRLRRSHRPGRRDAPRDARDRGLRHVRRGQMAPHTGGECHLATPHGRWPLGGDSSGSSRISWRARPTRSPRPRLGQSPGVAPRRPEDRYHLAEDLVDRAIAFVTDVRVAEPRSPSCSTSAPAPATTAPVPAAVDRALPRRLRRRVGPIARAHARPPAGAGRAAARDRAVASARLGSGVRPR